MEVLVVGEKMGDGRDVVVVGMEVKGEGEVDGGVFCLEISGCRKG